VQQALAGELVRQLAADDVQPEPNNINLSPMGHAAK
jgi:hypothetical protein